MTPTRRALMGGLALAPFASGLPVMAQDGPATPDALLDQVFAGTDAPALAGMIVTRAGVEWSGVRGVRRAGDEEAATLQDRWHLGSNTKAMTAALYARLVEQGRARWDMTLKDAFPGVAADAGWDGATVEALMSHRAGLLDASVIGREWLMTARADPRSLPEQRADIAARALTAPPAGPRGAFAYGNANYIVAGAAIEAITGRSWEDMMRDELFAPLSITSGGFGPPPLPNAVGHRVVGEQRIPMDPSHPGADNPLALGPAGTAHMALADYARFLGVFLNDGAGLLGSDSLARLTAPAPGEGRGYALGWGVSEQPWAGENGHGPSSGPSSGPMLAHEGTNTMWHAFVAVAPRRGLAFVAVANDFAAGSTACQALGRGLIRLRTVA